MYIFREPNPYNVFLFFSIYFSHIHLKIRSVNIQYLWTGAVKISFCCVFLCVFTNDFGGSTLLVHIHIGMNGRRRRCCLSCNWLGAVDESRFCCCCIISFWAKGMNAMHLFIPFVSHHIFVVVVVYCIFNSSRFGRVICVVLFWMHVDLFITLALRFYEIHILDIDIWLRCVCVYGSLCSTTN